MSKFLLTILFAGVMAFEADSVTVTGKVPVNSVSSNKEKVSAAYPGRVVSRNHHNTSPNSASAVVFLIPQDKQTLSKSSEKARLDQIDFTFIPRVLAVQVGTTVDFYNLDPVFHNVFSFSKPKKFDLGRYPKNHYKSVTFEKPGLIKLFCEIHSDMSAFILVLNTPYFTYPDREGNFTLKDVPPGKYTLKVWQEEGEAYQAEIEVSESETHPLKNMALGEVKDKAKMFE